MPGGPKIESSQDIPKGSQGLYDSPMKTYWRRLRVNHPYIFPHDLSGPPIKSPSTAGTLEPMNLVPVLEMFLSF